MSSTLRDDLRSFRRTWVHHTGMQLATLTVLSATFFVVAFVFSLSLNLKRVLASWGDGVQMTVYLAEAVDQKAAEALQMRLQSEAQISKVVYVPRETATANFKEQMASHAPDLLSDSDFAHPFPASFRISLEKGVATDVEVKELEALAASIQKIEGVEDVSWGQSWIKNYSSFVSALNASGGVMIFILLAGSLFVVGNSIRTSIAARRDEIAILELVGATAAMIRRPYVVEGLFMGLLASGIAIAMNLALYAWQKAAMSQSLVMARIVPLISFMDLLTVLGLLMAGALLGAIGAWITIRKINDGWAASQSGDY
jgi:cell division transport system permease protein